MKNIKILGNILDKEIETGKMKMIHQNEKNRFIFVNLKDKDKLAKHTSPHNLTVFALSGNGKIMAGKELDEELVITEGIFFQIEKDVAHEVKAEPELKLLLVQTK